jgi:hypothetical protein
MTQTRYVKFGTLSGLLLLCTIILGTTEDSQRLVFAQITPAPEKAGGSSSDTDGSNNNEDSSGSSSGSNDDDNGSSGSNGSEDSSSSEEHEENSDSSDADDSNDAEQSVTEDVGITTSEEETNPLLEAIMNKVTDELNAVGITDLGS